MKVRIRAGDETLTVKPPRRVFRLECGKPVEFRVYFGSLWEAFEFFEVAGFAPSTLQFSESVLSLETVYRGLRLRALVAGQLE